MKSFDIMYEKIHENITDIFLFNSNILKILIKDRHLGLFCFWNF